MREENSISKVRYPFTKSLKFAKVMEDPELCREFIRRLFPNRRVEDVKVREIGIVQTEATLIPGVYSRYIRLDVLFEDEVSWYNIEMQAAEQEELPQRGRYYSSVLDVNHLEAGKPYGDMKPTYVIFVCRFDYYGLGEAVYTFECFDSKKQLSCEDGSYIIILNTECAEEKVPLELRPFFQYIRTERVDSDDSFVSMIHQRVLKYQYDEEVAYSMTLEEDFLREREKAERKGREIGMAEGRQAGLAEGRETGLAEGREAGHAEMQARLNKLGLQLKEAGRLDDLFRSMEDAAYQKQLLEELGI